LASGDRPGRDRGAIVLATRSAGKLRELRALCAEAGFAASSLDEAGIARDPAEDGIEVHDRFEDNARAKALWFSARLPGRMVLAEDSGLEVDSLGGAPGVQSKRWAGLAASLEGRALDDANNAALLRALASHEDRRARYRCVAALVVDGAVRVASGTCEGRMVAPARGSGGFGYDPHFLSDELGVTFAEATDAEKSRVSHRGRAVRALLGDRRHGRAG
jgi:XTP/dITP diphosphohydrolase